MSRKVKASRRNQPQRPPGRPADIEGEDFLVASGQMLRSAASPANGGVYFLPIDEILRRKGWAAYQEMQNDDQVKATLAFKKVLVGGRDWEIKPAVEDDAKAKEIAVFVENNLRTLDFRRIIGDAMAAFKFGFSAGEIIWQSEVIDGKRAITIGDIKHRDPQGIDIKQDAHGNVLGFRQNYAGGIVEVDANKVWLWTHQGEFGNAYGVSDLRAAYKHWWAKKFIINFWNVYLERMGSPMTLMKYPQGAGDKLKETLKGILSSLANKTEVLVPDGVTVELVEATRSGNADYEAALDFHNNSIARSMLMVGLIGLGGTAGRGADSQSRLQLRILFKMADDLSQSLIYSFMTQVVRQLVDMNFEHDGLYPTFVWQDYGGFEGIEIADTIRQLHSAGVLDLDQTDVNYVRSILGLPVRDEDENPDDVLRPTPPPVPPLSGGGGTPPAAPSGNERAAKGAGGARKTDPNSTVERT